MPLQNRVLPTGEIVAEAARGMFMGNRGILHDDNRCLGRARWRHKAWVTCVLSFKGRHREVMTPGRYTELFFYDEAVAFAAGHRPCAECRRGDYLRFRAAAGIDGPIKAFDTMLHAARAIPRSFRQRRYRERIAALPDGTFILDPDGRALMIVGDALFGFGQGGYAAPVPRPGSGDVEVLTPRPLVEALASGYRLALRVPV